VACVTGDPGDTFTLTEIVTPPETGTAEIVAGDLYYTPPTSFVGIETFVCRLTKTGSGVPVDVPVTIAVSAGPVVRLSSPSPSVPIPSGETITLSSLPLPAGFPIASVTYYVNTDPIETVTTTPYETSWTPTTPGEYVVTVQTTDTANVTSSMSEPVTFYVTGQVTTVLAPDGIVPTSDIWGLAMSGDGEYVAFTASDGNLVAGDANGVSDVFLYDREDQSIVRISETPTGAPANGESGQVAVDEDGTIIVFSSSATNLITGDSPGDQMNIYVRNLTSGTVTRITQPVTGTGPVNGPCWGASVSADGRYISFFSDASNLAAGDTNDAPDLFIYDRLTTTLTRVADVAGTDQCGAFTAMSADGDYVAFSSNADDLTLDDGNGHRDAFVYDCSEETITRASISYDDSENDGDCWDVTLSGDGSRVAFLSDATNLADIEYTYGCAQAYVRDTDLETTEIVSTYYGYAGCPNTTEVAITADGESVVMASDAWLAESEEYPGRDVFLCDLETGEIVVVSLSSMSTASDGDSYDIAVDENAGAIAFVSTSTTLASGTGDAHAHAFVGQSVP
jgi:hypothetical protein